MNRAASKKKNPRKKGATRIFKFAVACIVAVLLGFIIWNSFLKPKQAIVQDLIRTLPAQTDTPVVEQQMVASDTSLGSGFALKYPKEWAAIHQAAIDPTSRSESQSDSTTITSPSGKIQVTLNVQTNTQVGGPCTADYIKLKYLSTDTTPALPDGRFAAYVVYFPGIHFYQYHAGLQKNTEAIRSVTLDNNTACNFMFSEFIDRQSNLPNVPLTRTLLNIRFVDLYDGQNLKPGVDESTVTNYLSGQEYEQAKAIVQSVYINE